jgi:hypothetical protein
MVLEMKKIILEISELHPTTNSSVAAPLSIAVDSHQ